MPRAFARTMALAAFVASCLPATSAAWEADVHFGLTRWLATQAGFTGPQADAIATGNQRADFGAMETMNLATEYACSSPDAETARAAQRLHFPSEQAVPAPPAQRPVQAGGGASTHALRALLPGAVPKAASLLLKLGEALHPLQDSWAHEGAGASVPSNLAGLPCDPGLMPLQAESNDGDKAHRADITAAHPTAALAMARATFGWLQRYPPITSAPRVAAEWPRVEAQLDGFLAAPTKAAKAAWFREHGMADVGFLEGISLPDGRTPWSGTWSGRRLPRLQAAVSTQHGVPHEVLGFFEAFFATWLGDGDPALALGPVKGERTPAQRELAARLRLWRMRDHGAAASLAHAASPLTRAQLRRTDELVRGGQAYAHYPRLADAFFPLMAIEPYASPLLPYVVRALPPLANGEPRMMATVKLRHAPYDELVLIARRSASGWSLDSLLTMVDH
ncbi:hypothetical protein CLU95_4566 [Variovorax sp. 54]|nr:hypothetical protein CLU95_4566 [Variovorax sp. 54]